MSSAPESARPHGALYPYRRPRLSLGDPLRLVLLGATGSIGLQTLDLVKRNPGRLQLAAVSCRGRVEELAAALADLEAAHPDAPRALIAVTDAEAREQAARIPGWRDRLLCGERPG